MDRRTLTVVALAVAAILAISLAAATLTSTVESEDGGSDRERVGGEENIGININDTENEDDPSTGRWLTWTLQAVIAFFVIAAVMMAFTSPRQTVVVMGVFAGIVAFLWLLTVIDLSFNLDGDLFPWEGSEEGDFDQGTGGQTTPESPLVLALAALVSVVLLGVLLASRRGDGETVEDPESAENADSVSGDDSTAIGAIAGRAADRIETGDGGNREATNEVYRAWGEMTAQLDLNNPDTATPREFQHHAIAAGMSSDDVRELTGLFEQVRYGGESATESREQRAVSVLRRIESTYGDEE